MTCRLRVDVMGSGISGGFTTFGLQDMASSSDMHLCETQVDSEEMFKGELLQIRRDTVRLPDGAHATREYVVHPGAVAIVALTDDNRVVVERQYRYAVDRVMVEVPAGKIDPGEPAHISAPRELVEETGYSAGEWAYAGPLHLAIGYSNEVIHIYFARHLSLGDRDLDEGEFLDVELWPVSRLVQACTSGEVSDAKTLACVLHLRDLLEGRWQPQWSATCPPVDMQVTRC